MNLQFANGTAQQQRWLRDAIAQCSYPLERLDVTVTVHWTSAFPSNLDSTHPYMCTVPGGAGLFDIYIYPWADDPANPGNQGLPDPELDIYEFYKQSFVHELGHVVIDSTFNPAGADTDPQVAKMCSLFWRVMINSGTGRRTGTSADWDAAPLAWVDEIREAVAEWFKMAFYSGRLVFGNRTQWNIDVSSWGSFLDLISIPSGTAQVVGTWEDDFTSSPDPSVTDNPDASHGGSASHTTGSNLDAVLGNAPQSFDPTGQPSVSVALDIPDNIEVFPWVMGAHIQNAVSSAGPRYNISNAAFIDNGSTWYSVQAALQNRPIPALSQIAASTVEMPGAGAVGPSGFGVHSPPLWIGIVLNEDGSFTVGYWLSQRPDWSLAPDVVLFTGHHVEVSAGAVFDITLLRHEIPPVLPTEDDYAGAGECVVDTLFVKGYYQAAIPAVTPTALFPAPAGSIAIGPGLRGAVALG